MKTLFILKNQQNRLVFIEGNEGTEITTQKTATVLIKVSFDENLYPNEMCTKDGTITDEMREKLLWYDRIRTLDPVPDSLKDFKPISKEELRNVHKKFKTAKSVRAFAERLTPLFDELTEGGHDC